eukprot:TRINITY_DN11730_c0_g1_i1.p2 TRINITY_DN11730_c0_g1~~TRINITY_DN11730_c0_g1_i1.p2  ORF type:complete len:119 (+),score=26.02 TRINITY_DN11730_c0_g1_i1:70-426(+)
MPSLVGSEMCIRDSIYVDGLPGHPGRAGGAQEGRQGAHFVDGDGAAQGGLDRIGFQQLVEVCLLYTSDAADDMQCVDLGGRPIIKKKKKKTKQSQESNKAKKSTPTAAIRNVTTARLQ